MAAPAAIRWVARRRARFLKRSASSRTLPLRGNGACNRGRRAEACSPRFTQVGRPRALSMWGDWTDRIAGGELPATAPARPQGRERNVVITMWDWADPKAYLHDEIASDKRNPTVNANGPIYGALEASADYMPVVDPVRHTATQIKLKVRDPKTPSEADVPPAAASPYWADERIWTSQTSAHSFAMDKQSRVWVAARVRPNETQPFCRAGFGSSFSPGVSTQSERTPDAAVRPEDERGHDDRYLLRHASPELRLQRRALVYRWRCRRRMVRYEDLRPDERRAEGTGLDGLRRRHQRQRQARRVCRARPGTRSGQGQASQRAVLRSGTQPGRRLDLGIRARRARHAGPADAGIESAFDCA